MLRAVVIEANETCCTAGNSIAGDLNIAQLYLFGGTAEHHSNILIGISARCIYKVTHIECIVLDGYTTAGGTLPKLNGTDSVNGAALNGHIAPPKVLNPNGVGVVFVARIFMHIKGAVLHDHFISTKSTILNPVAVKGAAVKGHAGNTVRNRHRRYMRFRPHTHCHLTGAKVYLLKNHICRIGNFQRNGTCIETSGVFCASYRANQNDISRRLTGGVDVADFISFVRCTVIYICLMGITSGCDIAIPISVSIVVCDIRITDGEAALEGSTVQINICYLDTLGNLGQSIELSKSVESSVIACICIIGVILTVVLVCILSSYNSDADAVDGQPLILVAGFFLHCTGNSDEIGCADNFVIGGSCFAFGQQNAIPISKSNFFGITDFNKEVDSFEQLCVAVNTADDNLVLESKVALVYDLEGIKIEGCTRLPQNVGVVINILEAERFTVERIAVLVNDIYIQSTCLDLVYRSGCGVGEPRKGGADEHCHAHKDSQCTGNQCPLGRFTTCHCCFTSLFNIFNGNM